MTTDALDTWLDRVSAGEALSDDALHSWAASPDILPVGMLADAARRRTSGARTTFLRVATLAGGEASPPAARELRLTAAPETIDGALRLVADAAGAAGGRSVSAYAWADVLRWADAADGVSGVLARLREAGLDSLAFLPADDLGDVSTAIGALGDAGFSTVVVHVARPDTSAARVDLWRSVAAAQRRAGIVRAVNPLPARGRVTTGYDDVKMVALARLGADAVPAVQVDWTRYGPKLAQVALTFGADDLDNVSASEDAPEGRRRAPLEEVRRNVEAAGFEPVERDGRFAVA